MSNDDQKNALERRRTDALDKPRGDGAADERNALAVDAAAKAIELLYRGGKLYLDGVEQRQASAAADAETRRYLERLDGDTAAALRQMEASFAPMREDTERLRMLLDHHSKHPENTVMGQAVAHFVRSLADRPTS